MKCYKGPIHSQWPSQTFPWPLPRLSIILSSLNCNSIYGLYQAGQPLSSRYCSYEPIPINMYKHRPRWESRSASTAEKPALSPRASTRKPQLRTAGSIKSMHPLRFLCIDWSPNLVYQVGFLLWKGIPSYSPSVFRPYLDAIYALCCNGHERRGQVYSTVFKPSAWLIEGVHSILAERTKE